MSNSGKLRDSLTASVLLMSLVVVVACLSAKSTPKPKSSDATQVGMNQDSNKTIRDQNGVIYTTHSGEYTNEEYGYALDIPPGLLGLSSPPPMPQHGFFMNLAKDSEAQIQVDAHYNSLFWSTLDEAVEASLESIAEQGTATAPSVKTATTLGEIPAVRFVTEYESKVSGKPCVNDEVIAFRREGQTDIVYQIRFQTDRPRYTADKKTFEDVVKSWKSLPF